MASEVSPKRPTDPAQLYLLHSLEQGLGDLQTALLKPDSSEIERLSAQQQENCLKLAALFREHRHHTANRDAVLPPEIASSIHRILFLNRVNAALLRRSRRSLEILSCLLSSLAATYDVPRNARSPTLSGEK